MTFLQNKFFFLCVKNVVLSYVNLGIDIFSKGLGDTYYPSNDMDPYLKDNHVSLTHF